MKYKKGSISLYIMFFFFAIIIVVITSVIAPLGVRFNSEMYLAGQDILNDSIPTIAKINDAQMRDQINASVQNAMGAAKNNIEVNANIFQYGWVVVIGLVGLVIFLFTRRMSEISGGGGFI